MFRLFLPSVGCSAFVILRVLFLPDALFDGRQVLRDEDALLKADKAAMEGVETQVTRLPEEAVLAAMKITLMKDNVREMMQIAEKRGLTPASGKEAIFGATVVFQKGGKTVQSELRILNLTGKAADKTSGAILQWTNRTTGKSVERVFITPASGTLEQAQETHPLKPGEKAGSPPETWNRFIRCLRADNGRCYTGLMTSWQTTRSNWAATFAGTTTTCRTTLLCLFLACRPSDWTL